ncbi:unnamed protein product [Calypogeia fissa]
MEVAVRPPVGFGLAKKNLDIKNEDGQRAPWSRVHSRTSFPLKLDKELDPFYTDRHRVGQLQKLEQPADERSQSSCLDPEGFYYKHADDSFGEDQKSDSSIDIYENRNIGYVRASNETSSVQHEKSQPISPVSGSRVRHWKSGDGPLSLTAERCNRRDEETAAVLDISPGSNRLDPIDLHFRENPKSLTDFRLAAHHSLDFKEHAFDFRKSAGLALENSAQRSDVNGGQPMALLSQWKKDTKAELRRTIQAQEKTWKMAEDAVEELGRRLELLEGYKIEIQDTLGRTRAMGNTDLSFKRLQGNLQECPRGYNSLYDSPIYVERKSYLMEKKGERPMCQDVCTSPNRPDVSKDSEIEKLKIEVAHLRAELQQRDSKTPESPKLKSAFQFSPRSPPSPKLPTSLLQVAGTDWSANFLSSFEIPLKKAKKKEGVSPLHPSTEEVIPEQIEPELADDSSVEMKTITIHPRQNGSRQNSNGKVDNCDCSDLLSSRTTELDVDDRGWVPIPDESWDKNAAPMFMENGTCQMERIDYQERGAPQEENVLSVDLNSDEGKLGVLKRAVHKLSCIFSEQEEKFKLFKHEEAAEDVKNFYVDMLKEMSQQLGGLYRDLHAKTQSDEVLLKQQRTIHKCYPLQRLVQKLQRMEMMGNPAATTKDLDIHSITEEDQAENIIANSENLRTALQGGGKKTHDQMRANLSFTDKIHSGPQYSLNMHGRVVAGEDHSVTYAQQLYFDLSNNMFQTETSLEEIRSRYKSLVSTSEQQLADVKNKALSLQDAVNILKEEIVRKENLVSNLETEAKEHQLQIEQLSNQIEAFNNGSTENVLEKLELLDSLEGMRSEMDKQQHRVTELISINEDLIAFSQTKEDEITGLKMTIKNLQQFVDEKSAEATKLSAETLAFSQEVVETRKEGETYRLHCTALRPKVEELEHELQARDASMERLTQHFGKTIEGQDFIVEETEQLLLSSNRAQDKGHRLDDQLRQPKIIIQDLQVILNSMDAEINKQG